MPKARKGKTAALKTNEESNVEATTKKPIKDVKQHEANGDSEEPTREPENNGVENVDESKEEVESKASKKKGKRGGKEKEESPEETEPPTKKEKKAEEEPSEKAPVKRGRKAAAKKPSEEEMTSGEKDEKAEGEDPEEEPTKKAPVKKGRKAAAKKPTKEETEEKPPAEKDEKAEDEVPEEEPTKKAPAKRGRKAANKTDDEPAPSKKGKKEAEEEPPKLLKNKSETDYSSMDLSNSRKTKDGREATLKIASWNVDGIRAWLKKNGLDYLKQEQPDIICFQETKCSPEKLPEELKKVDGYHCYWLGGETEGYAGVGLLSKKEPENVTYGIGEKDMDKEGRTITAEYPQFYLVTSYVPNSGKKLVTLPHRMKWNGHFQKYLKNLDSKKPVILCGDLNVSHLEIDLANPKTNKKNAGFTQEERDGFSDLLKEGFVDSFRHLYPDDTGRYTFWTYMMGARKKNVGWRLDYFVLSERFMDNLCDNIIRDQVFGSDHCPILLTIAV